MTLAISTVCTSIAALTIAGLHIYDLDNIPPSGTRLLPILFPDPASPISNFTSIRESFGGGSSALMNVEYDLNYMFVYCEIGAMRTGLDALEDCVLMIQAIEDAIISIDTIVGAVDITPLPFTVNVVDDPSGKHYMGCAMTFHVIEFWR